MAKGVEPTTRYFWLFCITLETLLGFFHCIYNFDLKKGPQSSLLKSIFQCDQMLSYKVAQFFLKMTKTLPQKLLLKKRSY